jgi:single-strand DNA-binding protein
MYSKITIVGYLGRDPELRYTAQGAPVTTLSVAANTGQDETTWFRVSAWNRQAETCNQYLSKGSLVLVDGRLTPDKSTGGPRIWTGNDGQARASYEVSAYTVKFLGGKRPPEELDDNDYEKDYGDDGVIPF